VQKVRAFASYKIVTNVSEQDGLTSCLKLSSSLACSPCEASMTFTATALPFHVAASMLKE